MNKGSPKLQIVLYVLQSLVKGFSIFFFVLLPVFYAEQFINEVMIGYVGAIFIVMLILGAIFVAKWLHSLDTRNLLILSSLAGFIASIVLLIASIRNDLVLLLIAYGLMGLVVGVSMSGVNALVAYITTRGDRFQSLAKIGMLTDLIRIIFPLLLSMVIAFGAADAGAMVIIFASIIFLIISVSLPKFNSQIEGEEISEQIEDLRKNKNFLLVLVLEFLDSFSSSQLFVFLPLLLLAKGYSLGESLILQSIIFIGYLSGRWLIGTLAKRYSGVKALALAEIAMAINIILLLFVENIWLLYFLTFALGNFVRGTSPVIKAVAFDVLEDRQMRKGSALHVVAGDSGSALGQLLFGLLVAWIGVNSPFIVAAIVALLITALCYKLQNIK